jgi:hypothetical protein
MRNEIRKGPGTRLKSEGRTQGRLVASLGVVLALPAGLACSGDDASDAMETGTARIALTQAPSGVGCVAITAQGVRTLTRSFDLTTGKSTDVEMAGLPTGVVNFTGNAFDTACNRVPASASATWISDVTTAVIGPGAVADVALLMRRNGRADVGVDWTADPPQPTVYEPFGYISGETALGESGGIGFSAPWSAGGFNASLHDNFVIASGSLAYPGLAVSGGHVSSSAQTSLSGLSRPLAHPIGQTGTATQYLSFLIQPEGVLDDGLFSGFFGLTLGSTQAELFVGKPGGQTDDYVMEDRGGGGQVPSTTATVVGQAALLVVKIEVTPTLDRLTLYVNPHVGAPEPATGIVKEDPILNEFDSVLLYSTGAFSLDEIRIGDTFASVTPGAS